MYTLQTSVEINGASFGIRNKGDFRMVLDCFKALNDEELTNQERIYTSLIIFYEDFSGIDDIVKHRDIIEELETEMMTFFNGGEVELESNTQNHRVVDWEKDAPIICSAINNVANKEIRAEKYVHWWTFLGYYMAVGECLLSQIVSIRYKLAKGKKLEEYEKKFKRDNPQYFNNDMRSVEQKEADEYIKKLWGDS